MRTPGVTVLQSIALAVAMAALGPPPWPGPSPVPAAPPADADQEPAPPRCEKSCRGLGIEKVKAGDEHCGLIPRERKEEALDAACGLAESHREELRRRAEERAREKCARELDRAACGCRTEMRPWQNVYTHVLSQRCWTECGWAFLIECDRRPDPEAG